MMRTILLSVLLFTSTLSAITLEELIESSLASSPSLEVIQARLEANRQNTAIATKFSNPELSITSNTLDSGEKMSQTVVSVKQKIEFYNKHDTKEAISRAEGAVLTQKLRVAQVAFVAEIKKEAYSLWELRELKTILDDYIKLTQKNIELYESYTSVDANQHMGIMKAKLSLADLKIQKSSLDAKIYTSYARLSYLSAIDVTELDLELKMQERPDLGTIQRALTQNPTLKLREQEIQKQQAKVELAELNNYPDINLLAGYAYRENFDNYMNFGLSLSLPIYAREDAKEQEARALELSSQSQKKDTLIALNATLKAYYAQMLSSYNIYHIIEDEALPQIAHMFELSSSSIATGEDLFKYIDVLFKKLALQQKSIHALSNYKKAEAKISELSGEIK